MQIIDRLNDISDEFDAVFCDVWGCIHNGVECFFDATSALEKYRDSGGTVLLLTNAPRPWRDVAGQFSVLGVPASSWDAILTSGDAAKFALFEGCVGRRVYHIGPKRDSGFFDPGDSNRDSEVARVGFEEAEGIVCTGLFDDTSETPDDYRDILENAARRNMPLLCANPDRVVDRGRTRVFCAGALADLFEGLGGRVLMFGKPLPDIYRLARRRLGEIRNDTVPDRRILCIGDGVATDLEGAARQSLPCLFVSGGLAARETGTMARPAPDRLENFCRQHGIRPDYVIGHLR